jgi:hypothetical protein
LGFISPPGGNRKIEGEVMKNEKFAEFLQKNGIRVGRRKDGSVTYQDFNSRGIAPLKIFEKYMAVRNSMEGWEYVSEQEIVEYMNAHAPEAAGEKERIKPTVFIKQWMDSHSNEWQISPMGKRITLFQYGIPVDKDIEDLTNEIQMNVYDSNLPYKEGEISRGVQNYMMHLYQDGVSKVFQSIAYEPLYEPAADKWIKNFYEYLQPEESLEILTMMLKHWLWLVKRKLTGQSVRYHIWLNLYGATGLGKTTAVTKMCSPLEDVTSMTTIAKLFDDTREIKRLTENYILIFDELAINSEREEGDKLQGDQQSTLKSMLTGEFLDTRVFKTQNQSKKKITFSCISSANYHLYDIIYDPTSMRRFFEFHCQAKATGDFSKINKTLENSSYLWKGINENLPDGYFDPQSELGQVVTKIQRAYYPTKSSVYDWIKETKAHAGNTPIFRAYRSYQNYCNNCGRKPKAMNSFIDDVKHAMPDSIRGESAAVDFTVTELCKKHKYYDDDLPSYYNDMKPVEPPTCGEFV